MKELRLDGQVAIVTGAGGGIGRSHALLLASRGASVVVNDLGGSVDGTGGSAGPAQAVVKEIQARGGTAVADTHSVVEPDGARGIVATALDAFGQVDILVNNAGILRDRSIQKLDVDDWDAVVGVHLRGTFLVTRVALIPMRDAGYGRIVNTTSAVGLVGNFGQANYAAAKAGIVGFTKVLATESERFGIKANAIAPAAKTRMTEAILGEGADYLDPGLVSPIVVPLAHRDCPVSGEVYAVGGGRVARVVIGETRGHYSPDQTPEDILEHWDRINDDHDFAQPKSMQDSFDLILQYVEPSARTAP